MPRFNDQTCGNDYTSAATLSEVWRSNGGSFVVTVNDVFMELQYGNLGQTYWTDEVHVPVGNGILSPGTVGVRFRNWTSGKNATITAVLASEVEPSFAIGTPSTATVTGSLNELGYKQITAPVTVASVTEATPTAVVAALPAITFDGVTVVVVQFYAPYIQAGTGGAYGANLFINLYDAGTSIGRLAVCNDTDSTTGTVNLVPCFSAVRLTPSAGAHTYSVGGWQSGGNGTVQAGAGGASAYMPAYLRVIST